RWRRIAPDMASSPTRVMRYRNIWRRWRGWDRARITAASSRRSPRRVKNISRRPLSATSSPSIRPSTLRHRLRCNAMVASWAHALYQTSGTEWGRLTGLVPHFRRFMRFTSLIIELIRARPRLVVWIVVLLQAALWLL